MKPEAQEEWACVPQISQLKVAEPGLNPDALILRHAYLAMGTRMQCPVCIHTVPDPVLDFINWSASRESEKNLFKLSIAGKRDGVHPIQTLSMECKGFNK